MIIRPLYIEREIIPPEPEPEPYPFDQVTIGTQTWTSKNLEMDDGQGGVYIFNNVTTPNNEYNMGTQYYYTWEAAVRIVETIPGWHLATNEEANTLVSYLGTNPAQKLKSTTIWSNPGTDDYGFNALPCGEYSVGSGPSQLGNVGLSAKYWLIDKGQWTNSGNYIGLNTSSNNIDVPTTNYSANCLQVRLIKDT